jgi:cytoskeletal protein CcmA (bactofilin family)
MFNKSKTSNINYPSRSAAPAPAREEEVASSAESQEQTQSESQIVVIESSRDIAPVVSTPQPPVQRSSMIDMIATPSASKPSILSEGFTFRGEINASGAIHVEGSLNGQIQVDELTIGARGQVEGTVTCTSLHIKGKFSGTATCTELIVTSSASVDGHVVYKTLSVQKGASIKGEMLLVK